MLLIPLAKILFNNCIVSDRSEDVGCEYSCVCVCVCVWERERERERWGWGRDGEEEWGGGEGNLIVA